MGDHTEGQPSSQSGWGLVAGHLPLVGAIALFAATALRLIVAARGSSTTGLAILQHSGTANALMGTVLDLVKFAIAAIPAVIYKAAPYPVMDWTFAATAAIAVSLFAVSPVELVLASVLVIWLGRMPWMQSRDTEKHVSTRIDDGSADGPTAEPPHRSDMPDAARRAVFVTMFVSVSMSVLIVSDAMWLPPEEVYIEGRSRPVVGYVLDTAEDSIAILLEGPREVRQYAAPVSRRRICEIPNRGWRYSWLPDWLTRPLGTLAFRRESATYPECD